MGKRSLIERLTPNDNGYESCPWCRSSWHPGEEPQHRFDDCPVEEAKAAIKALAVRAQEIERWKRLFETAIAANQKLIAEKDAYESRGGHGDPHEKGAEVAGDTSDPAKPTAPSGVVEALGTGAGSIPADSLPAILGQTQAHAPQELREALKDALESIMAMPTRAHVFGHHCFFEDEVKARVRGALNLLAALTQAGHVDG